MKLRFHKRITWGRRWDREATGTHISEYHREATGSHNSLAAEVRQGVAATSLDVSLQIPSAPNEDGKLVVCRDRIVGGAAVDSSAPCDVNENSSSFVV